MKIERRVPAASSRILAGLLCVCLQGCFQPAPPPAVNLDGIWANPQLGYDLELVGPVGVATQVRNGKVQNGDPVFRIVSLEGTRFTARQWLLDGAWHTVTGEWKDGKLFCRTEGAEWVLERRGDERQPDRHKKNQPIMP